MAPQAPSPLPMVTRGGNSMRGAGHPASFSRVYPWDIIVLGTLFTGFDKRNAQFVGVILCIIIVIHRRDLQLERTLFMKNSGA
eukprot:7219873-Pyramimonas_sp.AAC.2